MTPANVLDDLAANLADCDYKRTHTVPVIRDNLRSLIADSRALAAAVAKISELSTELGQLRGTLQCVEWQGGPEKVVAGFREENDRLRREIAARNEQLNLLLSEWADSKAAAGSEIDRLLRENAELRRQVESDVRLKGTP